MKTHFEFQHGHPEIKITFDLRKPIILRVNAEPSAVVQDYINRFPWIQTSWKVVHGGHELLSGADQFNVNQI